jgi:putative transposase
LRLTFYRRGVDAEGVDAFYRSLLHRAIHATGRGWRNREQGEWILDDSDCANLTDGVDGFFEGKRYLIHDRDPFYTQQCLSMLAEAGIESVKLPLRAPNLNAYAERFVRTIKEGCLDQMIFFGEDSLRQAIHEFVTHYHRERNHQGPDVWAFYWIDMMNCTTSRELHWRTVTRWSVWVFRVFQ